MVNGGAVFRRTAAVVNKGMVPALRTGLGRRLLGGSFAEVRYTGRRSGRQVVLPVNYRRRGDDVVVQVMAPSAKTWWRNFTGDGAPLTLRMGSREVAGHGVAVQDAKGRVTLRVAGAGKR